MTKTLPAIDDCWARIGVGGDRSCPKLKEHVHCRNCPVFEDAAHSFFDRPAPDGYLADWTRVLSERETVADGDLFSSVIFRLHNEWLALDSLLFVEVTQPRPVHKIPHRSNDSLMGIVNIRGQLQLCMSLHHLLGIEPPEPAASRSISGVRAAGITYPRMVVIEQANDRFVFPADEVLGVHRLPKALLRSVPSTLAKAETSFSQAVFTWREHTVGRLDEQRLLTALRRLGS